MPVFQGFDCLFHRRGKRRCYANKEDLVNSIMASRSGRGIYNTKREGLI